MAPRAPLSERTYVYSWPLVSVWAPTIHSLQHSSSEGILPGVKSPLSYLAARGQTPQPGNQDPPPSPLCSPPAHPKLQPEEPERKDVSVLSPCLLGPSTG